VRERRVLHLIKGLEMGGAERLLLSLTAAGDRERFTYHVAYVLTSASEHLTAELASTGVAVHCLGVSSHYDLRWLLRLRALLVREGIELVHLHLPYTASLGRLVVRSIPRSRRPRIVHTQHNTWQHTTPVVRALHRVTYRLDDADIAVSRSVWAALPRPLRSRTEVLVHGLSLGDLDDAPLVRSEVRSEFGILPDEVLVATVANMRKEKGYEVLLEAAWRLVSDGLPVHFVAVGHGPLAEEVRRARDELGLGSRFLLTGFRSDARRIVAGSDIFVLASHHEGFPVAVMEALAAGVPVVSTAVGDVPDTVGKGGGLVVPPGDPAALADALRALIVDPSRRRHMAQAALAAGSQFDIRRASARLEEIYDTLLSAGVQTSSVLRRDKPPATPGT
jgi:glycosyltransferase involved in cell wall biosynthesis